jgi:Arc/MetJ family transcription regulator
MHPGMRTTLDIPDELLERARKAASLQSKRDTVLAGLTELIRKADREELRKMAGKVDLNVDLKRSRSAKR